MEELKLWADADQELGRRVSNTGGREGRRRLLFGNLTGLNLTALKTTQIVDYKTNHK